MKRLLITLIAALALPNAVHSNTWYLLVKQDRYQNGSMLAVPMKSEKQCEQAGKDVIDVTEWKKNSSTFIYNCIKGK